MNELITWQEALHAIADQKDVEYLYGDQWLSCVGEQVLITAFTGDKFKFRLKPRTIMIGDMKVPAPFEPKCGDYYFIVSSLNEYGYLLEEHDGRKIHSNATQFGVWRTEEEIKQVVAALRKLFKAD